MKLQKARGMVDFAIITIREDECKAVLERFPGEASESPNRFYQLSRVPLEDGVTALVAVVRASRQGTLAAHAVARHVIEDLEPHWILLVGIAGGVPDFEHTLGDVVLSTRVNDLTVQAVYETAPNQFALSGGPGSHAVTKLVTALPLVESKFRGWNTMDSIKMARPPVDWSKPKSLYGDRTWRQRVRDSLTHHFGLAATARDPLVRAGPIDSSNTLIKDTKTLQQWLSVTRDALAVEMEAAGVYEAVRSGGREYPFLSIRGLSDIVGFKRHPDWTTYACHSAAAFTHALIKSGLVRRNKAHRSLAGERRGLLFEELGRSKQLSHESSQEPSDALTQKVTGFWLEFCTIGASKPPQHMLCLTVIERDSSSVMRIRGENFDLPATRTMGSYSGRLIANIFPRLVFEYEVDNRNENYNEGFFEINYMEDHRRNVNEYSGVCTDALHGRRDTIRGRKIVDPASLDRLNTPKLRLEEVRRLAHEYFADQFPLID